MLSSQKTNISRGVSMALKRNWESVLPCPKCDRRVYGNYSGTICKKCLASLPYHVTIKYEDTVEVLDATSPEDAIAQARAYYVSDISEDDFDYIVAKW